MEQRQCVLYGLGNTAYEPGSGRGAGGIGVAASRRFVHSTGRLEGISGSLTGHFPQYALSVLVRAVCAFGVDGRDFRSEERRVGKACRSRWWSGGCKKRGVSDWMWWW